MRTALAFGLEDCKIVHRLHIARTCGLFGPAAGILKIARQSLATFIEFRETVLRDRKTGVRSRLYLTCTFREVGTVERGQSILIDRYGGPLGR